LEDLERLNALFSSGSKVKFVGDKGIGNTAVKKLTYDGQPWTDLPEDKVESAIQALEKKRKEIAPGDRDSFNSLLSRMRQKVAKGGGAKEDD